MSSVEDFERERLRYCEAMYSLEKERKQVMERQAQFYFGLITIFLGALTLKAEVLTAINTAVKQDESGNGSTLAVIAVSVFIGSIVSSLVAILMVFKPERRSKPYPKSLVTNLFSDDESRGTGGSEGNLKSLEADFLKDSALRFALATEKNSEYNTKKSRWLIVAAISCFLAVLAYSLLAASILASLL